jgi:hypothetical protein
MAVDEGERAVPRPCARTPTRRRRLAAQPSRDISARLKSRLRLTPPTRTLDHLGIAAPPEVIERVLRDDTAANIQDGTVRRALDLDKDRGLAGPALIPTKSWVCSRRSRPHCCTWAICRGK